MIDGYWILCTVGTEWKVELIYGRAQARGHREVNMACVLGGAYNGHRTRPLAGFVAADSLVALAWPWRGGYALGQWADGGEDTQNTEKLSEH